MSKSRYCTSLAQSPGNSNPCGLLLLVFAAIQQRGRGPALLAPVFLNTCMRVCGGVGSGVCFSLFIVCACFWRGRLCFGRGRDRGFVLYISLFLHVLGWGVCVCLYTRVHTHKLHGYLMWAQVWDGHLESWKNPDRLKRSIHVDRIGVHSTFVYIYAGLRTLMIWANFFFPFNMSFLLRKVEDVRTISKSRSLTSVSIQDCTLRVPNETTTLFLLRAIIKAIFIHTHRYAKRNTTI